MKRLKLRPSKGDVKLYISLDDVEKMTVIEVLNVASSLGFQTELMYTIDANNSEDQIKLYAVLVDTTVDYYSGSIDSLNLDEQHLILSETIKPAHAVTLTYNLANPRIMGIAA